MIALEALAAGVPVIASDVGGLRDLLGVMRVRPEDPFALAAAIDRVLEDANPAPAIRTVDLGALDYRHITARVLAHAGHGAKSANRFRLPVRNQVRRSAAEVGPMSAEMSPNLLQSRGVR